MSFDFAEMAKRLAKAVGPNDESATVSQFLDTGFAPLNFAVSGDYNGGLPVGRIIEISGPESSGKTAISTAAMIAAQRMGGVAGFMDHERSYSEKLGASLGLDLSPGKWFYRKPRTFEDSVDDFVGYVHGMRADGVPKEIPICWVFDSLASMVPKAKIEKETRKQGMNDQTALSRATSACFPVIAQVAEETNTCVIFLNQIRTKIGVMFGDPTTTPGGDAPKYYASARIQLGAKKLTAENDMSVVVGQEVTARVIKNKVNRPFLKAKWSFLFKPDGTGYFDAVGSTLDFMVEKGVLKKPAKHIFWPEDGKGYFRSQLIQKINAEGGVQKLRDMLTASGVECDEEQPAEETAVAE